MSGRPRLALAGWLRATVDAVLAVAAAPACAACEDTLACPTAGPVCGACWNAVRAFTSPLCRTCGDPILSWRVPADADGECPRCRAHPPLISAARAIGPYEGSLQAIVQALKYGHRRSIAGRLAVRMRGAGLDVLAGADVVVPVPLHRRRQRQRGFNQAEDLARGLGLRVVPALRRRRHTPSQTDLPAAARAANVRGAFVMRRGIDVRGVSVVLVDDVATTGATLEACAAVLLAAGASEVRALTAARVATRRP